MRTGVPGKGRVLTQLSLFWFQELRGVLPPGRGHHVVTGSVDEMPPAVQACAGELRGRCMLVCRLHILPVEAIVRGYVAGGPWCFAHSCGVQLTPTSEHGKQPDNPPHN